MPKNKAERVDPFDKLIAELGPNLSPEEVWDYCRKHPREFIEDAVEEMGSIERLDAYLVAHGCDAKLGDVNEAVTRWLKVEIQKARSRVWLELIGKLQDADFWERLSKQPSEFEKELNRIFSQVRSLMKLSYNIPSQRPTTNAARDREIYKLKSKSPKLTFGEIGIQFKCSDKIAERAYKRWQAMEKKRLRALLTLCVNGPQQPPQKAH